MKNIIITEEEQHPEEYLGRDIMIIKDKTGKKVGILDGRDVDPVIVLDEYCPKHIVNLFSYKVVQKETPTNIIKDAAD